MRNQRISYEIENEKTWRRVQQKRDLERKRERLRKKKMNHMEN